MEQTNISPAILRWAPARFIALTSKCNLKQARGALVCGVKVDPVIVISSCKYNFECFFQSGGWGREKEKDRMGKDE